MQDKLTKNWNYEPVAYQHFRDHGNYFLEMNDADASEFEATRPMINMEVDGWKAGCTATVKRNRKGEVIVGRNMDVDVSQNPAFLTRVGGGKYQTVAFTYCGLGGKYRYDHLKEMDADDAYCRSIAFRATDAFNEKGLYVEMNLREMDSERDFYCHGTNPGKPRVCMNSAAALVAMNCATVGDVMDFLMNSYDWYTPSLTVSGYGNKVLCNMALLIGDATGEYGLFEFANDKVYFTPYANGQGNYYIHPELNEYAVEGSGYGRLAGALPGLPGCETARDMMDNMMKISFIKEMTNPGSLGYSDYETNINKRRAVSREELQKQFEQFVSPLQPALKAYFEGDDTPLRESGSVWTTSFNFGVNCAEKHLILRLWERDDAVIEYQF